MSGRIALIVPCFNDGDLVREALASIDEDEPVEVVVVDDHSTDPATLAMLEELSSQGVRVARHEENRGVGPARQTGLRETSAPYVFPLDADDLAVPGRLRPWPSASTLIQRPRSASAITPSSATRRC